MIEKLMDMERTYGEPEYGRISEQATILRKELCEMLGNEGRIYLERLEDTYLRRENTVLRDAFRQGFWRQLK